MLHRYSHIIKLAIPFLFLWYGEARACFCNDSKRQPENSDEAFEKAAVVFEGEVRNMIWKGYSKTEKRNLKDGRTLIIHHSTNNNAPEIPFDPKTGPNL